MQNLLETEDQKASNDDLIHISKNELRSLYRRIIECEKIIEEYKNKENMGDVNKLADTFNE